jgi:hypothetical protein
MMSFIWVAGICPVFYLWGKGLGFLHVIDGLQASRLQSTKVLSLNQVC